MPSLIYTSTKPLKKTPSKGAKTRALQESWAAIQAKYSAKVSLEPNDPKTTVTQQANSILRPSNAYRRDCVIPAGVKVGTVTNVEHTVVDGGCTLVPKPVYSGEAIGIAQMHKSNATLVYSQEAAIDIAKMRRG